MTDKFTPKSRTAWLTCGVCGLTAPDVRGSPPTCPDPDRCEEVKKSGVQGYWFPTDEPRLHGMWRVEDTEFSLWGVDWSQGEGSFHL